MPAKNLNTQIAFRHRAVDSATGVTRKTAKRLAQQEFVGANSDKLLPWTKHKPSIGPCVNSPCESCLNTSRMIAPCRQRRCGRSRSVFRKAPNGRFGRVFWTWKPHR